MLQPQDDDDYFTALMGFFYYVLEEIPAEHKQQVRDKIASVEPRTGFKVKEHLQFGDKGNGQIKYHKKGDNHYIGEINWRNNPHGRGITIDNNGNIFIGYQKDGAATVGNAIRINSYGSISVGEYYIDGNRSIRFRDTTDKIGH